MVMGLALLAAPAALGQLDNPVWVDHSPQAWQLFQQAKDQSRDNAAEAVRLYQEVLDELATKLVPISEGAEDHLTTARQMVLEHLRADTELLARYQIIQSAEAQRLLDRGELRMLARTRSLTAAGLEALLQLGQRSIEDARFNAAIDWLREASTHPDLDPQRAAHCWFMIALAAHYLDEPEQVVEPRERLRELGARPVSRSSIASQRSWPRVAVRTSRSASRRSTSRGRTIFLTWSPKRSGRFRWMTRCSAASSPGWIGRNIRLATSIGAMPI
jgi:tetratricopeptide (TPR) repeat protein